MTHYDYIILGAGASGLMMARAMAEDPWFHSSKILVLDKDAKSQNDRTWCFWEESKGAFDHLIHKSWDHIIFKSDRQDQRLAIDPYSYKMLRADDFYREHLSIIENARHIEFKLANVNQVSEEPDLVRIDTSEGSFSAGIVMNSFFKYDRLYQQNKYPVLQQHFIGWFVKADRPVFDHKAATFMDFSVPQKGNTRFMYVLPFSETEALVEYTLFSATPLENEEYEEAIQSYMKDVIGTTEYSIIDKEKGSIPMTCFNFEQANTDRIVHIGTAGGWAKASTGFTFKNTVRNSAKLSQHIKSGLPLTSFSTISRFRFYDLLLLDILHTNNELGSKIFGSLFRKRSPQLILKFLDENSSKFQDLQVITGCPVVPFSKAFLNRLFFRKAANPKHPVSSA